jgi:CRP/FNR family transcriptional regulator, anaerobic regulatory protein
MPLHRQANAAVAAMTQSASIRRLPAPPQEHPTLRGIPLSDTGGNGPVRLLSNRQRQKLASIAARLHLPRRTIVYREHTAAESVYIVGHGVVKAFRDLPSGKRPVVAFLFDEDIFGLAENGFYVNSIQAVTDVALFRMPLAVLKDTLAGDAQLQLQFLVKVTHELREAQHHTIAIGRRDAVGRVASLLRSLEDHTAREEQSGTIDIPMTRSDVAAYLGLSLEAVSRACRRLEQSGIVAFVGRHQARVRDRRRLDRLAAAY